MKTQPEKTNGGLLSPIPIFFLADKELERKGELLRLLDVSIA